MQGPNWPNGGEIDVFENVNMATNNRYTLHTTEGCTHPSNSSTTSSSETGTLISADCFNGTNANEGCSVQDPSTASYGAGFANGGGGVFAMLWNADGIRSWFFLRSEIPSDIASSPNPENWTTPTAFWATSSCDVSKFFAAQTLIFVRVLVLCFGLFAYLSILRTLPCAVISLATLQSLIRLVLEPARISFKIQRTMITLTSRCSTYVCSLGKHGFLFSAVRGRLNFYAATRLPPQ